MRYFLSLLVLISTTVCFNPDEGLIKLDPYLITPRGLKRTSCPQEFLCGFYLTRQSIEFDGHTYSEFMFPEENNVRDETFRAYLRVEGNVVYYHSDFLKSTGKHEIVFFKINSDLQSQWSMEQVYISGIGHFKVKQIGLKYDSNIADTLHTYTVSNYRLGVSNDYAMPLHSFTFSRTGSFQSFEYFKDFTGSQKIILKRAKK